MEPLPVIDLINAQLTRREKEFGIRDDSRLNNVWHEALSYWHYIFEEIMELAEAGKPLSRKGLLQDIAWAKEESMKVFGINRNFEDPESLWFFAVCKDILEPLAWRLARMRKRDRKVIDIRRRTAEIIQMPVR